MFGHLCFPFLSEGRVEEEIKGWIRAFLKVLTKFLWSAVVKKELNCSILVQPFLMVSEKVIICDSECVSCKKIFLIKKKQIRQKGTHMQTKETSEEKRKPVSLNKEA